ncbi:MAG TPA: zf-TFIIB domain-containing protein, partial [Dehalococcoidales bacterium]|nr:zf-TFIIB domain-containing protein [Dehalococcoidales bacterium]
RRRCPICNQKMEKVWLGENPRVLIENCPQGHGLWFDGDELHQLLGQTSEAGDAGNNDVMGFILGTLKGEGKP